MRFEKPPEDDFEFEPPQHNGPLVWLSVFISALANTWGIVKILANLAIGIIGFYLYYELVGWTVFVFTVISPIIVAFFYYLFSCHDTLTDALDDDDFLNEMFGKDDDEEDEEDDDNEDKK